MAAISFVDRNLSCLAGGFVLFPGSSFYPKGMRYPLRESIMGMVARTGIEPVVFALKGQRVNRLHYRALFKFYHTVTASSVSLRIQLFDTVGFVPVTVIALPSWTPLAFMLLAAVPRKS